MSRTIRTDREPFLREGHNCWQVAESAQAAFLIDGETYFEAVAEACEAAEQAIYVVGWDIDSRVRLRRGSSADEETFGQFIDRLAREKPALHVYLLEWDFAMLYSLERETWPLLSLGWLTHERVHFELDDEHPVGASHHQKIVVIDDRIAFVGGFDLAMSRWDTSAHEAKHPERVDNKVVYGPFHDIQMLVDGPVAMKLAELVRERWQRATGTSLPELREGASDPWPSQIEPDLEDIPVAILRTGPEQEDLAEIREIETFYLEAIAQAESFIYIENQYLTSQSIGKALKEALEKSHGPEILLVLPRECSGWLEQQSMGTMRQKLLRELRAADRHQRLKICYPERRGLGSAIINVHSKLMIVDDALLTIGSANLSNRSMGFDTECNLALVAEDDGTIAAAIAALRTRLLAEHLGVAPHQIGTLKKNGSLLRIVNSLTGDDERSLQALPVETQEQNLDLSADQLVDPERPIDFDGLIAHLGFDHGETRRQRPIRSQAWRFAALLGTALGLAALWRWSPLNQWLDMDTLLTAADVLRESRIAIPVVLFLYLVGSCLMVPITLLILATAFTFGPLLGFGLALSGSLLGGLASYFVGRWVGREAVRKLAGKKVNRLSRKIAKRGWLAIAVVRVVPIAPFTIINLIAGSTHISARSFLIGTAIGMGPGILAIMLFEGGLEQALRDPGWGSLTLAFIAVIGALLVLLGGKRWLIDKDERHDG